jgi:hypothetical protein
MSKIIKKSDIIRLSENTMRQIGILKENEEVDMEMYNEMDYMEEQALCEECGEADCDCTMDEADKPDFLDLDKDGDKKESMKKASKEKEEKDVVEESINRLSREASKHNIISENVKGDLERFNKIMNYKYH